MANGNSRVNNGSLNSSNVSGNKKMFNLTRNQIIMIVVVLVLLLLTGIISIDLGGVRTMLMNLWNSLFPTQQAASSKVEEVAKFTRENYGMNDLTKTITDMTNQALGAVTGFRPEQEEMVVEKMTSEPAGVESSSNVFQNSEGLPVQKGDVLSADDLLPKDVNSAWADLNPEGQGSLKSKNFLEAGYHLGINTQGQSLRNANLQLRSEPPNPQVPVSPWLQSTIEPDLNRRPLDVGY